jgi:hypothetical protein
MLAVADGNTWLTSRGKKSNFSIRETCCRCGCGEDEIDIRLIDGLQELRDRVKMPISITCATRCKAHNKEVGGAPKSNHLTITTAADIYVNPKEYRFAEFYVEACLIFKGVGLYKATPNFLHVDIRDVPIYWYRDAKGKYVYNKDYAENWKHFKIKMEV